VTPAGGRETAFFPLARGTPLDLVPQGIEADFLPTAVSWSHRVPALRLRRGVPAGCLQLTRLCLLKSSKCQEEQARADALP